MPLNIVTLGLVDFERLDDLGRPHRATLGFLPEEALRKILANGWVYGAISESGDLVGYLIYARYPQVFRITQLCVAEPHRGKGIAL